MEAELLVSHCRELQQEEGLSQSLRELEGAFKEVDRKAVTQEVNLQVEGLRASLCTVLICSRVGVIITAILSMWISQVGSPNNWQGFNDK